MPRGVPKVKVTEEKVFTRRGTEGTGEILKEV